MSSNVQEIERLAIDKVKQGDFEAAIELFKEAIFRGSQNFSCRFLLSRCLIEMERNQKFNESCELISQINEIANEKVHTNQ